MSEPDDRELEEFLAGRSEIARAYRADADTRTAPAALDAAVLAHAAAPMARARRMQRWRVPLTMAASLVLVVGVLQLALEDPAARKQVFEAAAPLPPPAVLAEAEPAPAQERRQAANAMPDFETDQRVTEEMSRRSAAVDARSQQKKEMAATVPQSASSAESKADRANDRVIARDLPSPAATQYGAPAQVGAAAESFAAPPAPAAPTDALGASVLQKPGSAAAAESTAAATAPLSSAFALRKERAAAGWQAATYQGLPLGHATLDDVSRRWGAPAFAEQTRSDLPLPDGRVIHRLLQYPDRVDRRGPVKLYFDANSQALASISVTLNPHLPLAMIEAQERLSVPGIPRATDLPLCAPSTLALAADAPYPQYRVYPAQGIYLLLTASDQVAEIDYFDVCR